MYGFEIDSTLKMNQNQNLFYFLQQHLDLHVVPWVFSPSRTNSDFGDLVM